MRLAQQHMPEHLAAAGIIGVDEAGRGPWSGPVVAAAVILHPHRPIAGLRDSKKLSATRREHMAALIRRDALAYAVAQASVAEIDQINILQATLLAMQRALVALPHSAVASAAQVWVDGNRCPDVSALGLSCRAIVGGDDLVKAIAAAAILAKTQRDALCRTAHAMWPQYGFDQHKGYGTAQHRAALRAYGPSPWHRHSFAPVKAAIMHA